LTKRSSRFGGVEGTSTSGRVRRQEQEPAAPEVTQVAPGILRSQLPISLPGLGHVNCYFLEDERGVAIVDPGLPGPQSWRALVDRLKQAGYKPRHVHTVIVTHSHPDHFGGAGRLRDTYGAEVVSHRSFRTWFDPAEDEAVADGAGPDTSADAPEAAPWGRTMPWRSDATFAPPLSRRLKFGFYRTALRRFVRTPAPTRRVDDAEVLTLAGREWVSLHTPGHTQDHLCLFDPAGGIVLSGDHVLPTITPHISGLVAGADPLSEFFRSLEKVAALDGVGLVLPAHGHPFPDLAGRATAIRAHHTERLETLRTAAGELGSATVEELSQRLFKPRSWGQMAESETYAHLEHLRAIGEAESRDDDGTLRYHLVG
jgi:glyoxylase-like metal-dependent hydrolase (beta-lactamase superfamily II)